RTTRRSVRSCWRITPKTRVGTATGCCSPARTTPRSTANTATRSIAPSALAPRWEWPGCSSLDLVERRERPRDELQRLALGADADKELDNRRADHQRRAKEIAEKNRAALAAADEQAKEPRRGDPAERRPERVEEGDRHRPRLDRKAFADRKIGGARRGRGKKEDAAPAQRQRRGVDEIAPEEFA